MPAPGNRRRTIKSAHTVPKIVFSGTQIAAMMSVSLNACTVFGSVSECHRCSPPLSNARQKTIMSGPISTISRYPRATNRSANLGTFVPRCEEAQAADREQQRE